MRAVKTKKEIDVRGVNIKKGRIIKSQGGFYEVLNIESQQVHTCKPRGNIRHQKIQPIVGDYVMYVPKNEGEDYGVIEKIEDRENEMNRPLISNVDIGIIVVSAKEPDFSFYIFDKFLCLLSLENIKPHLVVTKTDLLSEKERSELETLLDYYKDNICEVTFVNYEKESVKETIHNLIKNKIAFVMGQTGAGKSTLLNNVKPELNLETNQISKALGRGKHTTRTVCLYKMGEGYVADTPGFSSLELQIDDEQVFSHAFKDFFDISVECKFKCNCLHINEPNCAIKRKVENGEIPEIRYSNYLMFMDEVKENKNKKYK